MSLMKRWVVPGAVAVALVTGISLYSETEKIELDLTARAQALLASKDMDWASIHFDGRDGVLTGVAPEEGISAWAAELLDVVWGVRAIKDETELLVERKPYSWGLERSGAKLSMIGYLPYDLMKTAPDKIANGLEGVEFTSSVTAARGAPQDIAKVIELSSAVLSDLPNAKIMLIDDKLTISGQMEDGNAEHVALFENLQTKLASADLGSISLDLQIKQPEAPLEPEVDETAESAQQIEDGLTVSRTENGVQLAGVVPGEEIKTNLLDLARRKFGSTGVDENLIVREGDRIAGLGYDEYNKVATTLLQAISRLGEGKAQLTIDGLALEGSAYYDGALQQVEELINADLPESLSMTSHLAVASPGEAVDPAVCQTLMKDALADNTILFDSGKASISSDSFGLLDGLIFTARRCPESRIRIEGHTDSDGDDGTNQWLSEQRADAVVGYLATAGLSTDRLEPVGLGESQPVADNDTPEGKAKNRRIEFVILAQ